MGSDLQEIWGYAYGENVSELFSHDSCRTLVAQYFVNIQNKQTNPILNLHVKRMNFVIYKLHLKKVTLQYSHQPCADSRNNVTEEPFLYAICWQPRCYGERGEGNFLGPLCRTAETMKTTGQLINIQF